MTNPFYQISIYSVDILYTSSFLGMLLLTVWLKSVLMLFSQTVSRAFLLQVQHDFDIILYLPSRIFIQLSNSVHKP